MMREAVAGGWQFWACCAAVCRDGLPCGRPAAISPVTGGAALSVSRREKQHQGSRAPGCPGPARAAKGRTL